MADTNKISWACIEIYEEPYPLCVRHTYRCKRLRAAQRRVSRNSNTYNYYKIVLSGTNRSGTKLTKNCMLMIKLTGTSDC